MAEQTDAYLTSRFEDGDTPSGQDFADLIASKVNVQNVVTHDGEVVVHDGEIVTFS